MSDLGRWEMPIRLHLCLTVMDVEVRHLRALVAVAEAGSFSGACARLHITQPALSRTIAQLEGRLGVRLLERTTRSVRATEAGERFIARAQKLLAGLSDAIAEAQGAHEVRLGFSWLLPNPWAKRMLARAEDAGLRVVLRRCEDTLAELDGGGVDVVLMRTPAGPGYRSLALFTEPRVAVVSADSPLAVREEFGWDELRHQPLVINTLSGTSHRDMWAPLPHTGAAVWCTNYDEWLENVAAGRGLGIVPDDLTGRSRHPFVRYVPIADAPPVQVSLVWRDVPHGAVARFVDLCR